MYCNLFFFIQTWERVKLDTVSRIDWLDIVLSVFFGHALCPLDGTSIIFYRLDAIGITDYNYKLSIPGMCNQA